MPYGEYAQCPCCNKTAYGKDNIDYHTKTTSNLLKTILFTSIRLYKSYRGTKIFLYTVQFSSYQKPCISKSMQSNPSICSQSRSNKIPSTCSVLYNSSSDRKLYSPLPSLYPHLWKEQ